MANPVGVNAGKPAVGGQHAFGTTPYHPAGDAQTYRDLLIFEERLKQNAARLIKRKKKYQTFLVLLSGVIGLFSYYVFLHPSAWQPLHYFNVTVLLITATMLLLFFASGMYGERITAANKFIPQANRSLRSYNLYLNTRTVPRQSLMSAFRSTASSVRASTATSTAHAQKMAASTAEGASAASMQRVPSNGNGKTHLAMTAAARRYHIPTIPPSSNPRGELIFGSKVSPSFRLGYERYRAAFERRRREKMEERRRSGWRRWWSTIFGESAKATSGPSDAAGAAAMPSATSGQGHARRRSSVQSMSRHGGAAGGENAMRGSPRSTRVRPRVNTNNTASESETYSPSSSRAPSPTASPKVAGSGDVFDARRSPTLAQQRQLAPSFGAGAAATSHESLASVLGGSGSVRGRGLEGVGGALALSNSTPSAAAAGERRPRGRDRTPSVTALSDERLLQRSRSRPVEESGHQAISEEARHDDALDAAAADAALGQSLSKTTVPLDTPPDPVPTLVAEQNDDRADVVATLREPDTL